ncbi:MAG: anti-sigma factor antagonist [Phycisphaeraceae bacterium]|nr:anti-sigma factor antagonist [Phycisphaeraceae bacterium]
MPIEKWSNRIWVVALQDEPALSEDLATAHEAVVRAERTPSMVIDVSNLTHLNSSNLSQLLRLRKAMIDNDQKIVIAGMPNSVWAIFLTTGLDKVFEFQDDLSTALAGLQIAD